MGSGYPRDRVSWLRPKGICGSRQNANSRHRQKLANGELFSPLSIPEVVCVPTKGHELNAPTENRMNAEPGKLTWESDLNAGPSLAQEKTTRTRPEILGAKGKRGRPEKHKNMNRFVDSRNSKPPYPFHVCLLKPSVSFPTAPFAGVSLSLRLVAFFSWDCCQGLKKSPVKFAPGVS